MPALRNLSVSSSIDWEHVPEFGTLVPQKRSQFLFVCFLLDTISTDGDATEHSDADPASPQKFSTLG
jgi:hypothetical protein